ncbi:MAG: hypothetical protein LUH52_04535 [Bacteroides uniformis]|nr:hypothetical protein [Bacteroides uniformis]
MEEIAVIDAKVNHELYLLASEETKMKSEQRRAVDTLRLMNSLKHNEELEYHLGLHQSSL